GCWYRIWNKRPSWSRPAHATFGAGTKKSRPHRSDWARLLAGLVLSAEAESHPLARPVERNSCRTKQFLRCQRTWLLSSQDFLHDLGRQPGQSDDAGHINTVKAHVHGEFDTCHAP